MMKWSISAAASLAFGLTLSTGRAGERDEAWVLEQVRQVKQSDTSAWKKIPWAPSLVEARRAGAREKRPLFLFTHDGNIETGRC